MTTLSSMFRMIANDTQEFCSGRIRFTRAMWIFGEKGYMNPQGVVFKPRPDRYGRLCSLKPGKSVLNCPLPPETTPIFDSRDTTTNVPYSHCRKCAHYRKTTNRRKYACCEMLRIMRSDKDAGTRLSEIVGGAVRKVEEILG